MITVVIADDQDLVRAGLRSILENEADITVVAEASDGAAAAAAAERHRADVVLMDLQMPGAGGLEGLAQLRRRGIGARVLVLTMYDVDDYVEQALRSGAQGFLLKTAGPGELVTAVRDTHAGRRVFAPSVIGRLVDAFLRQPATTDAVPERLRELSRRELEVLRAIAEGLSNAEIGQRLYLTEATVKTYVTRLLGKLGVRDRVQAAILAYRAGLPLDSPAE